MPPSTPETAPLPTSRFELRQKSRPGIDWRWLARIGLGLVLAAWGVLLASWLVLHWWILPHLDDWRPQIEARATQALGVPVHIGRIEVRSGGWVPALRLSDVVLTDAQGHEALRLPQVAAAVSPRSLFALTLRFEQLLIDGPQLEVRRDAQGRIFVAGLALPQNDGGGDHAVADWFFEQHEFVIRHGSVRWVDERQAAPPLALSDVDLVVRNGVRRHAMRLDATPPADWGQRFSLSARFSAPLLARAGDWRRWSGTLHASLPRADLSQLRRYVHLPAELIEGEGALRAWIDLERGEARSATVDAALNTVALRLQPQLEPLVLQQLQGRLIGSRTRDGVQLSAQNLSFVTAQGEAWPRGNLHLGLVQRQDQLDAPVTGGEFNADRLDLALMVQLAERLPIGAPLHRWLAELKPQGQVQALASHWDGPLDAPQRYQVRARLRGVAMAAGVPAQAHAPARPGWRNADIDLNANQAGGDATLAMTDGAMEFPGVFEEPVVPLAQLKAQLAWRIDTAQKRVAPAIELQVRNAHFANDDAEGTLDATWHTGTGGGTRFPGVLDMNGQLVRGRATAVARYLPQHMEGARAYVSGAVQGGQIDNASFKVKGDLAQFPFTRPHEGEFHIVGQVSDVTLAYVPPPDAATAPAWPPFTQVAGELVFDRNGMEIRHAQARVFGYALSQVEAAIRDFAQQPTLVIEGQGRGPLAEALRYVGASPVGGWTSGALQSAAASGGSELKLALALPLHDMERATVKGSVTLLGDELRLRPDLPQLAQAKGRVEFDHKGFVLRGVSAQVLGGDAAIDGGTQADGSTRINVRGTVTADGLRRASELPVLARMAGSFSGQTPYRLSVGLLKGRTEFSLNSPLTGMALALPAPLGKSADSALPLRVQNQLDPSGAARDTLRIELGRLLQAQYQRDLSRDTPQVLAGAVALQEPLPPPAAGVVASLSLGRFDADAWRTLAQRWSGDEADAGTGGGYLPRRIALRADELRLGGRRLDQLVATVWATPDGEPGWRASVAAQQVAGNVEYRPGSAGRVVARLTRLALPRSDVASVEHLLDEAPASLPALDIVVDDFELRDKRLGKLEVAATNVGDGGTREWRLSKLNLSAPDSQFRATGRWHAVGPGRRRMTLDFTLDVADSGALLQRLGTPGAIKGGKGSLQGQLGWAGSPFDIDYPSLEGRFALQLGKGQFLKAGAGAGRLLGVLSLQALPRRLLFDFRDLFQEGFAFDELAGDVQIHQGVASTHNLRMRGVPAVVLMEGQADLQRETQDLHVVVVPEVNAGAASLAYAAINPAVGLGTFVAQLFLRKPLMQAGTREFHVTGDWDEPKVERVERSASAPLPDIEAQAPPAPAPPAQ